MLLYNSIKKGGDIMSLEELRYSFTEHRKRIFIYSYENFKLLVHPSIDADDLLNRLEDDIKLLPEINPTIDKTEVKFYRYDYNEQLYSKDELLAYLYLLLSIMIGIL